MSIAGDRVTHVAFADDMTLVATSWLSMKRMLSTLRQALARRGLAPHPSKCKLQTNSPQVQAGDVVVENGFTVEAMNLDASLVLTRYFGLTG